MKIPTPPLKNNWLMGKKVLVTGATNGIGRALALLLIDNGATVIAHGRSASLLESLAGSMEEGSILTVLGDLREKKGWQAVEAAIVEQEPEAVVINAGYNCRKGNASSWTDTEVFEMIQVNLTSPILCVRTFVGLQKLNEARRLALILSTSCHFARSNMSLYTACKTGLMGFGKSLQQEALDLGVRTVLFYPGRTNSNFRQIQNETYMSPESVAQAVISILCLPNDLVPYEFTFRPESDTYI